MNKQSENYVDQKGRLRWHCNDQLAEQLKQLHCYLVIGNYDESHAARYPRLAHLISRFPESVLTLKDEGRLTEIPGVSKIIEKIIREFLETGTCSKMEHGDEFFDPPPKSVLEMTAIPGLGAKTAKMLFQEHGHASLASLLAAANDGSLGEIKGVGKGMIRAIQEYAKQQS